MKNQGSDFTREAALPPTRFLAEMWTYLRTNQKWWLTPIIVVLLILGAFIALGGTAAAPFIYTLF